MTTPTQGEHAQTESLPVSDALRTLHEAILNRLSHAELLEKAHYLMELNSNQARTIGELQDLVEATPAQPAAPQGVAYAELPDGSGNLNLYADPPAKHLVHGGARFYNFHQLCDFADRTHALRASNGQAPAGTTLPAGWVPLVITHEGQYPEEVAYGPQILMDRLGKWLRKYFDSIVAGKAQSAAAMPDLQPLHNLLYLAQRQTSLGAMQRVVGEARLELAKVRDVTPTAQAAPVEWDGKLPTSLQRCLNALRLECPPAVVNGVEHEVRNTFEALHTTLATTKRMYGAARDRLEAVEAAQAAPAGDEQKALAALRYYKTECSGAEPSISVFHRMVDEALGAAPADGEEFQRFTTGDSELNDLLNETFAMARGPSTHDTAMLWLEALEAVKARLAPVAGAVAGPSEPTGRTDAEIVEQTEELASFLLSWAFNHEPGANAPAMRDSTHPFAQRAWSAACHIQDMLTQTDVQNALAELENAPEPALAAAPTAAAQADSVLEDAALLQEARDALWQPANVALCERIDSFLDAARKQGASND